MSRLLRRLLAQSGYWEGANDDTGAGGGAGGETKPPGDDAGGAGAETFTAETARTYLKDVVADPDGLPKLPDEKAIELATGWRDKQAKAPAWRDNWREAYAKTDDGKLDDKRLKRLQRYASPTAAFDALLGLQNRISAGELRAPLPKDATVEQQKAWREENGIPESPDKYALPATVKIEAEDKPYVDKILTTMHGLNANNQMASAAVDLFFQVQDEMSQARAEQDKSFAQASEDTLRAEFGQEYRLNMNMVNALTGMMPKDVGELFTHGRLANGDPIMSHPGTIKWLVALAREINPVSTVVPNAGADVAGAIDGEIAKIEGWMKYPRESPEGKKYWDDEKVQARYRELLDARERSKTRRAA